MDNKKKYRIILTFVLIIDIILLFSLLYVKVQKKIPERLYLYEKESQDFDFSLPMKASLQQGSATVICNQTKQVENNIAFDFGEPFSLYSQEKGSCSISVKFLGLIPVRQISVNVIEKKQVHPGGETIGIKIDTNGILVLGTGTITGRDGQQHEPAKNIVQSGDYIYKINNVNVSTKEELSSELGKITKKKVIITVKREEEPLDLSINAVETEEGYKLGIWVRDDTQGIGTLTYYDDNGNFAALGHGISDIDTGTTMNVKDGYICNAGIYQIVKGSKGKPGEISGYLKKDEKNRLGTIFKNSRYGIRGTLFEDTNFKTDTLSISLKQEIEKGNAEILCQVNGQVEQYQIKIEKINLNEKEKGLVLHVVDSKLLSITGGIIQGMSGSPIIQNGKLIGAVTHVFVNDPTRGYGIFIENMLE